MLRLQWKAFADQPSLSGVTSGTASRRNQPQANKQTLDNALLLRLWWTLILNQPPNPDNMLIYLAFCAQPVICVRMVPVNSEELPDIDGSNTEAEPISPATEKRGRGRPKGSRNKVGRDARALLAADGLGAVKTLLTIASGHRLLSAPDASGARQVVVPTLDQRIAAARTVLDRLVPALKATEISGGLDNQLSVASEPAHSTFDIAKALLSVLNSAAPTQLPPVTPSTQPEPHMLQRTRQRPI